MVHAAYKGISVPLVVMTQRRLRIAANECIEKFMQLVEAKRWHTCR